MSNEKGSFEFLKTVWRNTEFVFKKVIDVNDFSEAEDFFVRYLNDEGQCFKISLSKEEFVSLLDNLVCFIDLYDEEMKSDNCIYTIEIVYRFIEQPEE